MKRHKNTNRSPRRESDSDSDENPDKDTLSRFSNQPLGSIREKALKRADRGDRRRKIQRIREEIRRGEYETKEKLAIAIDRLIEDYRRSTR